MVNTDPLMRELTNWWEKYCSLQRIIIFFAAEDIEVLYSQKKQYLELTVAQIISSLLKNSDWIEESRENH